jgi:DtxR family transcriptional regulator, Mn-dependent transcriptional regulator
MRTINTEDYVKAIYKLTLDGGRVTTSALAAELHLADASITDMIKRLSDKGLINYERYRGVTLLPRGKKMALGIVRRHRLWEMYLVTYLGYSWDKVHEEAERLEHVTSDELEERLDSVLGRPTVDPHGDPIPTVKGELNSPEYTSLDEFAVGDVVTVQRVSDHDSAMLLHASKLGVVLHKRLTVKEKRDFDGSMVVKVGTRQQFISREMAESIFVREV